MGAQRLPPPLRDFLLGFPHLLEPRTWGTEGRMDTGLPPRTPHHELAPAPQLQARGRGGGAASPLRAFVSVRKRTPFLKTLYFQLPENRHNKYTDRPHL